MTNACTSDGIRRSRRGGSVLILVVALLVLMALVGTAFIVTARTDRASARLHTHNVQADMAVQSAVNMVTAELTEDLFGPIGPPQFNFAKPYRPPTLEGDFVGEFETWDAPGDNLLSPRVPVLLNPTAPPTSLLPSTPGRGLYRFVPNGVNPPVWLSVSGWPDLPVNLVPEWRSSIPRTSPDGTVAATRIYAPTARPFLGRSLWPHLQLYVHGQPWDSDKDTPEIDPLPAADSDGDGIADAVLWKLPMGPMNGVTYYAAQRVIDNNSAINVNTALARNFDFAPDGKSLVAGAFFTGRVGLAEMLRTYNPKGASLRTMGEEFVALNAFRFNGRGGGFETPYDEAGRRRQDFEFATVADALQSQLARRIGNPGTSIGSLKYRPFTLSDSMALGYRFCLADLGASRTALEWALYPSLFEYGTTSGSPRAVPAAPYQADEIVEWMERFRYDLELPDRPETFRDLRALLVARNPVSNQAPARYAKEDINGDGDRNDLPAAIPTASDPLTGGTIHSDSVAIRPYVGMQPFYVPAPGRERVRATPPVPINTASFPELWRGFWSVMTPYDLLDQSTYAIQLSKRIPFAQSVYYGSRFTPPTSVDMTPLDSTDNKPDTDPTDESVFGPVPEEVHPHLMFRSSLRDNRLQPSTYPLRIMPGSQLLLRAALAAVNTEDLRDSDDDVTGHLIELRVGFGRGGKLEEKVPVRIYGTERQPYITEVYVNTDDRPGTDDRPANRKGYVAIELFNPHPADIRLDGPGGPAANNGWSIGLIDRRGVEPLDPAIPAKTAVVSLKNLDPTSNEPWRFPEGTYVPANGYLVLENHNSGALEEEPGSADSPHARYRPIAATLKPEASTPGVRLRTVYVPDLHRVLFDIADPTAVGGEFVLLRPRLANGTSSVGISGDNFDETKNLRDLIPVDQFDFTGVALTGTPGTGTGPYTVVHYVRANGSSAPWRFVYPGRYDGELPTQRHQGTVQVNFGPGMVIANDPFELAAPGKLPGVRLGGADPMAHPNQGSFTIQVAAPGFGGPDKVRKKNNRFPFGMFARAGDLLQVPFIGAYTIYAHPEGSIPAPDAPSPPPSPSNAAEVYEMNSLSMDSVFAEDSDVEDDLLPGTDPLAVSQFEQIGRFCPVRVARASSSNVPRVDDFADRRLANVSARSHARPEFGYPNMDLWVQYFYEPDGARDLKPVSQGMYRHRYRWAMDLFEQFCFHAPHTDFFPNVRPDLYEPITGVKSAPVANSGGVAGNLADNDPNNDYAEDLQPVEGLININTAPWKVLAALPMVLINDGTDDDGKVDVERNAELAKAIVWFRDIDTGWRSGPRDNSPRPHGPFKSIYELNTVVEARPLARRRFTGAGLSFRHGYGTINLTNREPGFSAGDLSPGVAGVTDGVRGDFEENYLVLNRISNLITTRSDSFTCYVFVMGVQNDGTPEAQIKVQRRVAFIADRSGVRPLRPVVRTQLFNNE